LAKPQLAQKITFSGVSNLNRTQVKFLYLLQLTQNLYNWLKLASWFYYPRKAQALQAIWDTPATFIP